MVRTESLARRAAYLAYGLASYAVFVLTFLYAVGFVGGFWASFGWTGALFRSLDGGPTAGSPLRAALADASLLGVFALQHSGMARASFKRRWTRFIPEPIERSTYVLAASLALALLFWQWRPLGGPPIWNASGTPLEPVLIAVSAAGWGLMLLTTFLIDHLAMFGLRQVWCTARGLPLSAPRFASPGPYRAVRHPLYLGFLVAFWAAPVMSPAHLVFAGAATAYVLVGIQLEERDLVRTFGDRYRAYRKTTSMLLPLRRRAPRPAATAGAPSRAPASPAAPSRARTAS
jgi:methanethiol S-methyltransferase